MFLMTFQDMQISYVYYKGLMVLRETAQSAVHCLLTHYSHMQKLLFNYYQFRKETRFKTL